MIAIGQEVGPAVGRVVTLRIELGNLLRNASRSRHSINRARILRENDDVLTVPASAACVFYVTDDKSRPIRRRHAFQFAIREESDITTVRGPECEVGVLRPRQGMR